MSSVICNPFTPIPISSKSHVRGWAIIWSQRLQNAEIASKDTDLSKFEKIYIEHGVNFSGSLNLFGGFTDDIVCRLNQIAVAVNQGAQLFFLDRSPKECNYTAQITKRIGANTTSPLVTPLFVSNLELLFSKAKTLTMFDIGCEGIILGDSHSVAFSKAGHAVCRNNGQTLYSAMKSEGGLFGWINGHFTNFKKQDQKKIKEIEICLGSIDIRFHLLKKGRQSASQFAAELAEQVQDAQDSFFIPISVCAPVPVEYEQRKLPKTGQYEGVNFNGSRQERLDYTLEFINALEDRFLDFNLVSPPKHWYHMEGEDYAHQIMEMGSSVHISPQNYRSVIDWE